jgi:autophagy-related protein 16-1
VVYAFGICDLASGRPTSLVGRTLANKHGMAAKDSSLSLHFMSYLIAGIHEGGITSVQFNPSDSTQVLTNSLDSSLKIVDVRTGTAVQTLRHAEFSTSHGWSRSVYSPDGRYVASGSSSNGNVFVWDTSNGELKAKLSGGHQAGVVGIDWCRGGSGGQQVASIDRKGVLVLWA